MALCRGACHSACLKWFWIDVCTPARSAFRSGTFISNEIECFNKVFVL